VNVNVTRVKAKPVVQPPDLVNVTFSVPVPVAAALKEVLGKVHFSAFDKSMKDNGASPAQLAEFGDTLVGGGFLWNLYSALAEAVEK
jgi:hypothetical protein